MKSWEIDPDLDRVIMANVLDAWNDDTPIDIVRGPGFDQRVRRVLTPGGRWHKSVVCSRVKALAADNAIKRVVVGTTPCMYGERLVDVEVVRFLLPTMT